MRGSPCLCRNGIIIVKEIVCARACVCVKAIKSLQPSGGASVEVWLQKQQEPTEGTQKCQMMIMKQHFSSVHTAQR